MSAAVVRLPTAAARKVKQPATGKRWTAAMAETIRFPIDRTFQMSPYMKHAAEVGERMMSADVEALKELVMALYSVCDRETKAKIMGRLLGMQMLRQNSEARAQALACIEYEDAPLTRKQDILNALAAHLEGVR